MQLGRTVILNVDDTEAQRYAITRILENAGFIVWQAASGEEALQQVARRPDLVILDVNLPDISGFEVCRRIKQNPETALIPVLHQSAMYVDAHAKITALEGGADAYLVHPIEPGELLATVRALLRLCQVERKLRDNEERLRLATTAGEIGTWDLDVRAGNAIWSENFFRLLGYNPHPAGEATHDMWVSRVHPDDRAQVTAAAEEARRNRTLYSPEYRIIRADNGQVAWLSVAGRFLFDTTGEATRFTGVAFDITRRKVAEEELRRAEATARERDLMFRRVLDSSLIGVVVADMKAILDANDAFLQMIGYTREDLLAGRILWHEITPPQYAPLDEQAVNELLRTGSCRPFEKEYIRKDGSRVPILIGATVIAPDIPRWLCFVLDLTERRQMQETEQRAALRRQVLKNIIEVQERERRYISRELHDEAGQLLASLLVGLRAMSATKRLDDAKKQAKQLRAITHRAMDELGKIARGLHPTALDDFGLAVALERHLQDYESTHGLRVSLKTGRVKADHLPAHIQVGLYRIIQEALTNVARHARARHVTIQLKSLRRAIEVTITDDGKGFNWSEEQHASNGHFGLKSMRERAELLGGKLEIASGGRGTSITATIPVSAASTASTAS